MPRSFQLLLGGQPADDALTALLVSLEVEESLDLPSAVRLLVPVSRSSGGDLTYVSDSRFMPLATIAVVATPAGNGTQCIFDGYVLSQRIHLETGTTNSTLAVWGQDVSWLMNLSENVKEWVDVNDADVANSIFSDYGINPSDQNAADDSPSHTEDGHSLMQRASDIVFLRTLARRTGKICRIACDDQPGQPTGYFAKANLDGDPICTLDVNDLANWTVSKIDLEWDATRPTSVVARQALFTDSDSSGANGDSSDSNLTLLGSQALADFTGQAMTVMLAAPVDDAGELVMRAQALLRDGDWFVRCQGETDVARLGVVLRAGSIIAIDGIGSMHSGNYLVSSVRHKITTDAHTMFFQLMRNAVGDAA